MRQEGARRGHPKRSAKVDGKSFDGLESLYARPPRAGRTAVPA